MKRKKKYLWFPSLHSINHILELLIYAILISFYIFNNQYYEWRGYLIGFILTFLFVRILAIARPSGGERFIKIKRNKLYVCKDLYYNNKCELNENTVVYQTQLVVGGRGVDFMRPESFSQKYGGVVARSIEGARFFIILKQGTLKSNNYLFRYGKDGNPLFCASNVEFTHKLANSKNAILIGTTKRSYKFLRQYLDKEQFVGVSEKDKSYLEALEKQLLNKTKKQKDV